MYLFMSIGSFLLSYLFSLVGGPRLVVVTLNLPQRLGLRGTMSSVLLQFHGLYIFFFLLFSANMNNLCIQSCIFCGHIYHLPKIGVNCIRAVYRTIVGRCNNIFAQFNYIVF